MVVLSRHLPQRSSHQGAGAGAGVGVGVGDAAAWWAGWTALCGDGAAAGACQNPYAGTGVAYW